MLLLDYVKSLNSKDKVSEFAVRCGTTFGQMMQVAREYRRAGESLCINIDRETGGIVTCEELRPDVDWAYLRNSGGSSGEQKEAA